MTDNINLVSLRKKTVELVDLWVGFNIQLKTATPERERKLLPFLRSTLVQLAILATSTKARSRALNTLLEKDIKSHGALTQKDIRLVKSLSHLSYLYGQKSEGYLKSVEKREGRVFGRSVAHAIDSFARNGLLESLEQLLPASLMSTLNRTYGRAGGNLAKLLGARKSWRAVRAGYSFRNWKSGDLILEIEKDSNDYHNTSNKRNSKLKRKVFELFTGSNIGHVGVFHREDGVPMESHVTDTYRHDVISMGEESYMVGLRLKADALLKEEVREAVLRLIPKAELQKLLHEEAEILHTALPEIIEPGSIRNGFKTMAKTLGGSKISKAKQREIGLTNFPTGKMACSQFASKATMALFNRFEGRVLRLLEQRDKEATRTLVARHSHLVRTLKPNKTVKIHPGGLARLLVKQGMVKRVARHSKIKALFPKPSKVKILAY